MVQHAWRSGKLRPFRHFDFSDVSYLHSYLCPLPQSRGGAASARYGGGGGGERRFRAAAQRRHAARPPTLRPPYPPQGLRPMPFFPPRTCVCTTGCYNFVSRDSTVARPEHAARLVPGASCPGAQEGAIQHHPPCFPKYSRLASRATIDHISPVADSRIYYM